MLQLVLQFVNQIVVGALGATAIAAVGFANSLTFIVLITFAAFGASASILIARAHGGGRTDELNRTIATSLMLAAFATTAFVLPVVLWTGPILEFAGASPTVVEAGTSYLRISALAVIPGVLCMVLSGVMRSLGHARRPMIATFVTVALNGLLGVALVFGLGPFPQLGVPGAGWATLITTVLKLGVLLAQLFGRRALASWTYPARWYTDAALLRPIVVLALPLGVTELVWSTGTFLYNVIAQQLGDEALAAAQIVNSLEAVFFIGSLGLMSATTALVGRSIGRGDATGAADWARRVTRVGVYTGATFGLLFAASSLLLGVLFADVTDWVRTQAMIGILFYGVFQVVKVRNMIVGAGVLPSGSDTRGVIAGDFFSAFVVGLPLALLLALHTPLGVFGVFVGRVVEELVKMAIFGWRARRLPWEALASSQRATA